MAVSRNGERGVSASIETIIGFYSISRVFLYFKVAQLIFLAIRQEGSL